MSTFFTTISNMEASISAPDETTVVLHHFGGKIVLNFSNSNHMNQLAAVILQATAPPEVAEEDEDEGDRAGSNDAAVNPERLTIGEESKSSDSDKCNKIDDGSEMEYAPSTPNNEDPDSSFESYDGIGATQEVNF